MTANEPQRPIPSGRIPGRWPIWIALAGCALSLLLGALLGSYLLTYFKITVQLGNPWLNKGIVALAGAVVLLFLIGLFRPRSFHDRIGDWWRRR